MRLARAASGQPTTQTSRGSFTSSWLIDLHWQMPGLKASRINLLVAFICFYGAASRPGKFALQLPQSSWQMRCSLMMFGVLSLQGFLGTLNSNGLGVQVLAARFLHHILLHLVHGSGSIGCQRISRPVDCFGTVNWRICLFLNSAHFANLPSTVTVATAQWAPAGVSLAPRISGSGPCIQAQSYFSAGGVRLREPLDFGLAFCLAKAASVFAFSGMDDWAWVHAW